MADGATPGVGLVGDIGGTNVRFALAVSDGERRTLMSPQSYLCRDFQSAEDAAVAYLRDQPGAAPSLAVLAVAGPVIDGAISFTNTNWHISETEFSAALGLRSTRLINDYAALAFAAPLLEESDTQRIGPDLPGQTDGAIAIFGAGTGFGCSALAPDGRGGTVLTTEAGHIALAPNDELEVEIWRRLHRKFGRVSVERVLSGPGLLNLYGVLCDIEGAACDCDDPVEVTRRAKQGDAIADQAMRRFCSILGSVAGDLALAYGAQGGVFIAGGVTKHLIEILQTGDFRARFESKGRFESYLQAIPTRVISQPHTAALLGAAHALVRV